MDEIVGYIERFTFHNEETGFTVAQLKEPRKKDLTCVVGSMAGVKPGETLRCYGSFKNHLLHGQQFELSHFKSERPADLHGIKKYLGSGLIKGIGPKYAEKIVEKFGAATLDIIENDPDKLLSINGLGGKKLTKIIDCWRDQKSIREVMIFLQSHGVSPAYAQKIFKTYGDKSIVLVTENPYRLAKDIYGIGFKMADQIAQKMGMEKTSKERIQAGIEFLLNELNQSGHVCYPEKEFIEHAKKHLEVEGIEESITYLVEEGRLEKLEMLNEGTMTFFVWLKMVYIQESGIARELKRLKSNPSVFRTLDTEKAIGWAEKKLNIVLAKQQKEAVAKALEEKVLIITGGPGTGKSTITNVILTITQELSKNLVLAAPTGRAAKRMSEITKKPAKTIHSLLEVKFNGGGFKRNRDNPIEGDLIIVDESSMIDTALMYAFLRACPDHARVIFIGDINQLPSVGSGNVLKDLIASQTLQTMTLTEIFRQAKGSQIILNAHRINQGKMPDLVNSKDSDFFFIEHDEQEKIVTEILSLVTVRLPQKYGFNPLNDIQVLSPMRKGLVGIEHLNQVLQQNMNARGDSIMRAGQKFAVGDKVMQVRNNYQKEVYNGDIGILLEIDSADESLIVVFEDREIIYDFNELDELRLAYAVSIHKYQGSEGKCIIIPVHSAHYILLTRNLLYTGVTRGKMLVILIGTKKAIFLAVNNNQVEKRYTGLRHFLLA